MKKINFLSFKMNNFIFFSLIALCFLFPLSSSGKSIFLILTIGLILSSAENRNALLKIITFKWVQISILMFLLSIVACFWSIANSYEKYFFIEKYSKLLCFPILISGFQNKQTRHFCLHAFLAAMLVIVALYCIKIFAVATISWQSSSGEILRNRIIIGMMMAFAAYISAVLFMQNKTTLIRIGYLLLFLIYSAHVLLINTGRSGYVLFALLMMLWCGQMFTLRKALLVMIVAILWIVAIYFVSPAMHQGINEALSNIQHYQDNKNTNVGYRIQFHQYAAELFSNHPVIGNGTAAFSASFRRDLPVDDWQRQLLEPHSQYWLMLADFGLLGFGLFIYFLWLLFKESSQLTTFRPIAFGLLLIFVVGNFSDSLLFYSGSGYFFIIFMALSLAELKLFKEIPQLRSE